MKQVIEYQSAKPHNILVKEACKNRARGVQEACKRRVRGVQEACKRRARGVQEACKRRVRGVQEACKRRVRGVYQSAEPHNILVRHTKRRDGGADDRQSRCALEELLEEHFEELVLVWVREHAV